MLQGETPMTLEHVHSACRRVGHSKTIFEALLIGGF